MTFIALIFSALITPFFANAEWIVKPQAGLGYTSNANYEDSDEDSDFYLFLRNSTTFFDDTKTWNFWVSYKTYAEEKQNDAFTWRLGHEFPRSFGNALLDVRLSLGGQHYTGENPGTTEDGFDYIYGEGALGKTKSLKSDVEVSFEGGYQFKSFTRFHGRWDHTLFFNTQMDWLINSRQTLSPFGEFAIVLSNDSLYRKNYFEFGVDWRNEISKDLKILLGFLTRFSTFPNRTVTQTTAVSRKRGVAKFSTQEENETQTLVQLKGSLVKMFKDVELTGSLLLNNQNSKSGFEDYTELSLLGFASFTF